MKLVGIITGVPDCSSPESPFKRNTKVRTPRVTERAKKVIERIEDAKSDIAAMSPQYIIGVGYVGPPVRKYGY